MLPMPRVLVGVLALAAGLAAQVPDTSQKHVKQHKVSGTNTKKVEIDKNKPFRLKEVWKKVDGTWIKTWSVEDGGPYTVAGQATKKSEVSKTDGSRFAPGDEHIFVIEPTDADGNTVEITKITEVSQ
jgi:hypothetical protein